MEFRDRDVVSIRDFSRDELESIFSVAKKMEEEGYDRGLLRGKRISLLFYEPSTRTRLSFEAAANSLGADTLWFAGVEGTSVMKGETLKDTIETVANYSDAIVIRHPYDGAARWAAEVTTRRTLRGEKKVPVINGGDGRNEHPTQTMLDLYSILVTQGKIDGITVALVGDLKYGRTVHSFAYALGMYRCRIRLVAPEALQMPPHVLSYLESRGVEYSLHRSIEEVIGEVDVLYMTRIQKERFPDENEYNRVRGIYRVSKRTLQGAKPNMRLMHPLPRVDEISPDADEDFRSYYFKQAGNGVPVRAALLAMVLEGSR
ncbi:MAG: aspartate carbamoyltransferase [Candidatus Verstraetearchaeota archaeon]|nr:aspartate carbamoyltransferase [Candidatus Verstraetearchaeota archaeon]